MTYSYTYDNRGNILSVVREAKNTNVKTTTSYTYDGLNQLTQENNQAAGKTWVYTYDAGGNILTKKEYAYTTGTVGTAVSTINYEYNDDRGWKDILTSYNGVTRTHDEIGNLLSDGTWTYTWEAGRRLKSMTKADGTTVTFAYDNKGLRLSKTVGDVTYRYTYNGGNLVRMEDGSTTQNIRYDDKGQPMTIAYSGLEYFYVYNAQGDVVAIAKYDGTIVVEYAYDAWGNILSCTGSMAETLGKKNPFRYRGYVYDEETGFYYLKSRYYDPKVGRFICADKYESVMIKKELADKNLLVYCDNNPVIRNDPMGTIWATLLAQAVGGVLAQYAADVLTNIKDKDVSGWEIFKIRSGWGDYISAAVTACIPGVSFKMALLRSTVDYCITNIVNYETQTGENCEKFSNPFVDIGLGTLTDYWVGNAFEPVETFVAANDYKVCKKAAQSYGKNVNRRMTRFDIDDVAKKMRVVYNNTVVLISELFAGTMSFAQEQAIRYMLDLNDA